MLNNNKKAFSLVVAMFLMILTSLLALYLLEYIIPFSRNTKGMENGTKAYYESNKGIEEVLYSMKGKDPYFEISKANPTTPSGYYYSLISTGSVIPAVGKGTSEFDINYNKIGIASPVQLYLKGNITWNLVKFYFKVPQFNEDSSNINFKTASTPIINWQLSSDFETLMSTGSYMTSTDINSSTGAATPVNLSVKMGETLSGDAKTFQAFYSDENCAISGCTLKLSIINELYTSTSKKMPYLEYKIDFDSTSPNPKVANYYAILKSSGKSSGYKRDLELYIPQQTTISAFDFAVFQ